MENQKVFFWSETVKDFAIFWNVWELLTFHRFYFVAKLGKFAWFLLFRIVALKTCFLSCSDYQVNVETPEPGRKHVFRAAMRKRKIHENFPYLTKCSIKSINVDSPQTVQDIAKSLKFSSKRGSKFWFSIRTVYFSDQSQKKLFSNSAANFCLKTHSLPSPLIPVTLKQIGGGLLVRFPR